jgi:SPP1 gp7 family putative phage head morphogenesis protein
MSIPEVFFRETIDLNRYSNAVATEFQTTYNDVILTAARKLKRLNIRQAEAGAGVVIAPQTRKRLRAIIQQSKISLDMWSKETSKKMIKEIEGVAKVQTGFIENELKKVVKSGSVPINSVAVSEKYAKSFVTTDPTKTNIFTSKEFTVDDFKKYGSGTFELTARQGAIQTLPNGVTVEKAFRGIAENQKDALTRHIRQGVFSGESTQEIARRMIGKLEFGQKALSSRQKALAGGELTIAANHQIRTIVRTSVNQVQNQASQAVYAANSKVAPKYQYVATLDSRTSAVCRDLDGKTFAYNRGPTPPQHFNCRSTTVPVVDYEGLSKQKGFEGLKPPPVGKVVTRPSATGRVPQDMTYGEWLLKQDKKLQVKTLGSPKKVSYFKKLAKKEGSGQKAIKKLVRDDDSERSLKDLQRIYGKPTNIKPKPKPKAVVGTAKASDFVKSKPLKKLTEKELLTDLKKFREHEIKIQTARGVKNPYTGPIDFKINSLEQGLSIEKVIDKGSPMYNDYLFWKQGFNKRPTRVKNVKALKDRKDLVKGADGENLVLYRGVSNDNWNDQFKGIGKGGDNYYAGEGLYGNGTYAAARNFHGTKASLSKSTKNAIEIAEHYTQSNAFAPKLSVAEKQKRITAFGLKKDANFKTWKKGSSTKNLKNEHAYPDSDWYKQTFGKWEDETIAKAKKLTGYDIETVGEACTILGIDGYQVPLPLVDKLVEGGAELIHFDADYWVILNRSAIVVSDTVKL